MEYVLFQWFFFLLIGIIALPKTAYLFRSFPDRGYPLAKVGGWVFVGYLVWFLGSMGLMRYTTLSILVSAVMVVLIPPCSPLAILRKPWAKTSLYQLLEGGCLRWRMILMYEVFFFILLGCYALIRAYRPDIY